MIAIGCDHGGFELKKEVLAFLEANGFEYKDFGTNSTDSVNYAPIAAKVARAVAGGECEKGILICGTGIGMSLAANKVRGIRAACCSDHFSAKYTRLHNDSNILCMGGRVVGAGVACELVDLFLNTEFEGGRHAVRIEEIAKIEEGLL
ncbi:MAG: ribose 5-phosphate isomerase B [Clostridia bacterium]|nr:ribose 5-phosphate isomerase B [Clostridia bacterium]